MWRRMLTLLIVICLLLIAPALIFSAPFLVCDPQSGVDSYKVTITGPAIATQDVSPDSTGTYGFKLDLATLSLPDGSYTAKANATNMWGTSSWSADFLFIKSVPTKPANIRLKVAP